MKSAAFVLIAGLLVLLSWNPGSPESPRDGVLYGRVTRVSDGDTLTMRTADDRTLRIRLAEIDAPERGKPFADRSRQALAHHVAGKAIAVRLFDVDKYARIVGRVYVDETDVNAELVRAGMAVVYRFFAKDPRLIELEREAREARRGLWVQQELPEGAHGEFRPRVEGCGDKRRCSQMESCREALFYLDTCGVETLDGDGDGVPCERSLCAV